MDQRVADLEAYINNVARTPDVASKVNVPGPGHNAWQMTSTALVLFMTLPGLALFYGGLVRVKNVLSILAMCMGIAGLVTILWWLCGYSLTFGGSNPFIGDLSFAMFKGMSPGGVGAGYYWISDYVWAMFQLTFAIITPALIFGATAERMKFAAVLLFTGIWMFLVYFPLAHMVWSTSGFMCGPLNRKRRHQGYRLRGWHCRAYVIRLDRSRIVPDPWPALRLWQGAHAATLDGAVYGRHGNALRGLVRF